MGHEGNGLTDKNIITYEGIITPVELRLSYPLSASANNMVQTARRDLERILDGEDKRKLLVVGPCSIHDVNEAKEYANRLKELSERVKDVFVLVMRTYFEKPRTTLGWTGLISDPDLNGEFNVNKGLRLARELLVYNAELGLPAATEMLDTLIPQYTNDIISWACIGARTAESQPHRHMSSGLSMPVGIKNGTNGEINVALNALHTIREPHSFVGMNYEGEIKQVRTKGNQYCHLVLRGGSNPNYSTENVRSVQEQLRTAKVSEKIMIDCSHGNSSKDYKRQPIVFNDVINQITEGNNNIVGLMLESNLEEGNQKIPNDLIGFDRSKLKKGVSITDGCISWRATEELIMEKYKALKRT